MQFYVYFWLREDGSVYYVGKGREGRAFLSHKNHRPPKDKQFVLVQNYETEAEAFEAERFFISFYGRKDIGEGRLINKSEGGVGGATRCGYKNTEYQKSVVSFLMKGKPKSETHRKNLSLVKTGKLLPLIGASNMRRRMLNPTPAAIRNRRYRAKKKAKELVNGRTN